MLAAACPLSAQLLPAEAIVFGDGRVTLGGDVSGVFSCANSSSPGTCGEDLGFFNYSDYEHSTLRMFRVNVNAAVRANRHLSVLTDIRSGAFAQRFIDDQDAGAPEFKALREKGAQHPIEGTGRELRKLMAWVDSDRDQDYVEGSAAR